MAVNEDFAKFLKDNGLSNREVASYIQKSPQFVSLLLNGKCKLPPDILAKILDNTEWDTSMLPSTKDLVDGYEKRGRKPYYYQSGTIPQDEPSDLFSAKLRELEQMLEVMTRERDALAEQCAFLKAQITIKDEMIKYLMNNG